MDSAKIIEHINEMEHDGWCAGCDCNADDCMKMFRLYGYVPECLGDIDYERTL